MDGSCFCGACDRGTIVFRTKYTADVGRLEQSAASPDIRGVGSNAVR